MGKNKIKEPASTGVLIPSNGEVIEEVKSVKPKHKYHKKKQQVSAPVNTPVQSYEKVLNVPIKISWIKRVYNKFVAWLDK